MTRFPTACGFGGGRPHRYAQRHEWGNGVALTVQQVLGRDPHAGDLYVFQAALLDERAKRIEGEARAAHVEAELAVAKAKASNDQALIAHQQLQIAKLTRELYGQRSERGVQPIDQMALAFEELESSATEDEAAGEQPAHPPVFRRPVSI
jgi:Transposase C of IS166 homeodomain